MLNIKSQLCAFLHLHSVFAFNERKSPANVLAFHEQLSTALCSTQQPAQGCRGEARAGSAAPAPAVPHEEKGLAFLPFPPAEGIPGAGWERNPAHCWNGEGEEAHSFTILWAGLALAYSLTH